MPMAAKVATAATRMMAPLFAVPRLSPNWSDFSPLLDPDDFAPTPPEDEEPPETPEADPPEAAETEATAATPDLSSCWIAAGFSTEK